MPTDEEKDKVWLAVFTRTMRKNEQNIKSAMGRLSEALFEADTAIQDERTIKGWLIYFKNKG